MVLLLLVTLQESRHRILFLLFAVCVTMKMKEYLKKNNEVQRCEPFMNKMRVK